ncbi:glycosyltransferase [Primorskyibacter sp. S87]|uniref:glycosyltransferase n=1 Tax=Primorskyibacter sp. S87 TaxID=3415126 RepID=UPI003C7CB853
MAKHILHLVTRLLRAGSEENTMATCEWQARAGYRVTLAHGAEFDQSWYEDPVPGVRLIQIPQLVHALDPIADLRAVRALRGLYRDLLPDVVHTHQSKAGILGRLAADAAPSAQVVHGIHIVPFQGVGTLQKWLYLAAECAAARRTDAFVGVSDAVGQAYVQAGVTSAARVHTVRSGMDLNRFRNAGWPQDWRAILGLSKAGTKPPVAVMLASFEPRKRHVPFLRAFAKVAPPDMLLVLAGQGPLEAEIRDEIVRLGFADQVILCGHREDPEALLALADLSILASEREGLPRVVIQSLAAGCPVVVSALPGIDEVVRHGVNGIVADGSDMRQLASSVAALFKQRSDLLRLGQGAAETDTGAWGWDELGRRTTEIYGLNQNRSAA